MMKAVDEGIQELSRGVTNFAIKASAEALRFPQVLACKELEGVAVSCTFSNLNTNTYEIIGALTLECQSGEADKSFTLYDVIGRHIKLFDSSGRFEVFRYELSSERRRVIVAKGTPTVVPFALRLSDWYVLTKQRYVIVLVYDKRLLTSYEASSTNPDYPIFKWSDSLMAFDVK